MSAHPLVTQHHPYQPMLSSDPLFAVQAGIPLRDAIQHVVLLVGTAKDVAEGLVPDSAGETISPHILWGIASLLDQSVALLEATLPSLPR